MSAIWNSLIELQNNLISQLAASGTEVDESGMKRFNQPGWVNRVWSNDNYRRAHIDVVDMREQKKLWMMHVCVFPNVHNDGPIYGFDVIAGPNKMTGAFHDFSANWAKEIFTDHMIAAGMVKEQEEIDQICRVARENMCYYLGNIGEYNGYADCTIGKAAQNNYAHYQKQNPHTPAVMKSLGLNEDDVDAFVNESLFPEI